MVQYMGGGGATAAHGISVLLLLLSRRAYVPGGWFHEDEEAQGEAHRPQSGKREQVMQSPIRERE